MRTRYQCVLAAVMALAMMVVADVQATSSWNVELDQGDREGLTAVSSLLEIHTDAQESRIYPFPREGRYRSRAWPVDKPPATVLVRLRAQTPAGTAIRLHLRVKVGDQWQPWDEIEPLRRITLGEPAEELQLRAVLLSAGDRSPVIDAIEVVPDGTLLTRRNSTRFTLQSRTSAPTHRIYATREGLVGRRTANGHRITRRDHFVALPSWRVLNDRGEYDYLVRVTYKNRSVVVPVWDVGPWNTRDDYWSAAREMWRDLPRGLPQAQAAYQLKYNGGRDQFGRRVRLPNGIDIADGTFWDDLGLRDHSWVYVTFLWLGDQPTSGSAAGTTPGSTTDKTAPDASITSLVEIRNRQYFMRWAGKDNAGRVASFDVQVRHGAGSPWKNWLVGERSTEGLYKARASGSPPSFRVRARDAAGNVGDYSALQAAGK